MFVWNFINEFCSNGLRTGNIQNECIQNITILASLAKPRRKMNNVNVRCEAGYRRKEAIFSSFKRG